jgi:arylsulfatase A-like enzyme
LVSTVDLSPTFLTAAGLPVPGLMQGYDQTPVWCPLPETAPPLAAPRGAPARVERAERVTREGVGTVSQGMRRAPRDHVIVENRHQPTRLHLRSYVDERYKLTVYRDQPYGELFDLQEDPDERRNLWDSPAHAGLKAHLSLRALQHEISREPTRMPRIAGA